MTITSSPTSSQGVLNKGPSRTQVGPLVLLPFALASPTIDNARLSPLVVLTNRLVPPLGVPSQQAKRGRGRPKGSKNKKNPAGTAASPSEVVPPVGEKRKRGRPPKVCSPFSPTTCPQTPMHPPGLIPRDFSTAAQESSGGEPDGRTPREAQERKATKAKADLYYPRRRRRGGHE
jgi:hypothetical protein